MVSPHFTNTQVISKQWRSFLDQDCGSSKDCLVEGRRVHGLGEEFGGKIHDEDGASHATIPESGTSVKSSNA
jgi:hypothetical protein